MTGTTEHQGEKAGPNTDLENELENELDNLTNLPQGADKQSLKEAADAILKSSGMIAEAHEELGEENADPLVTLVNDLKIVHEQKDEMQNQLLRSAAEMENLRKRTRKELADVREFAIASFARDLLNVTDNLRRAVDAVTTDEAEADTGGLKNLLEGVAMTERELQSTLEKHRVRKMSAEGEKFDPNYHQAMFEVPDTTVPHNTIMEVIQEGYVIGERMLRPAMVGVSKGGPKIVKPQESAAESEGENPDDAG